jgi:zinc protease
LIFAAMTSCARHPLITEYQFPNGLKVIIIPVKKAELVSLVTLYSIGESSDPPGKSGMAHLIEHLYVTSAAGEFPSRSIDQFITDYPKGWNAQTGMDYTVIATVFPTRQLDAELRMAAARMKDLKITENDLDREIPRIERELDNMYGGIPMIASQNLSAEMLLGSSLKGREGGVIEQLRTITVDELRARARTFYKPANAQIIISGSVEPKTVRKRIEELFSDIDTGEPVSVGTIAALTSHEKLQITEITPSFSNVQSHVALSYRAPSPADRSYPAFLVLAHRLQVNSGQLKLAPSTSLVFYAPLDRPEVISFVLPVGDQEIPEAVLSRLEKYVAEMRTRMPDKKEIKASRRYYNFMFCRETYPEGVLARDPYGVAFVMGRKKQFGVNGDSLMRQIGAVTNEELSAAGEYLSPEKSAAAIVKVKN